MKKNTDILIIHFDVRYYLQLNIPRPTVESGVCSIKFNNPQSHS